MEYAIYRCSTREPLDNIALHVLARAYYAAWESLYATQPVGRHVLAGLDVLIRFGPAFRD